MKRLVIFDLDGTLLNTIDDLGAATNHALEKAGFSSHPLAAYPAMVGNGVKKLLERALPSGMDTDEEVERLRVFFREYYDEHCADHTKPYPGIPQWLETLRCEARGRIQQVPRCCKGAYRPLFPVHRVGGSRGTERGSACQTRSVDSF